MHCRLLLILACLVAGCAELPVVDDDIARAVQSADTGRAVDLIREQTERIARRPFIAGNAVELLRNGAETYAAMMAAIRRRNSGSTWRAIPSTRAGRQVRRIAAGKARARDRGQSDLRRLGLQGASQAMFARLRKGGVRVLEVIRSGRCTRWISTGATTASCWWSTQRSITAGSISARSMSTAHAPTTAPNTLPWRDTDVRIEGPGGRAVRSTYS